MLLFLLFAKAQNSLSPSWCHELCPTQHTPGHFSMSCSIPSLEQNPRASPAKGTRHGISPAQLWGQWQSAPGSWDSREGQAGRDHSGHLPEYRIVSRQLWNIPSEGNSLGNQCSITHKEKNSSSCPGGACWDQSLPAPLVPLLGPALSPPCTQGQIEKPPPQLPLLLLAILSSQTILQQPLPAPGASLGMVIPPAGLCFPQVTKNSQGPRLP